MPARVDAIGADIAEFDAKIEQMFAPFAQAAARLDEIPGIGPAAAAILIAEIGTRLAERGSCLAGRQLGTHAHPRSRLRPAGMRGLAAADAGRCIEPGTRTPRRTRP